MKAPNTSARDFLKEDLIRLSLTILIVAIIIYLAFYLENKTHIITRLFRLNS